jgi:hypothetical protein
MSQPARFHSLIVAALPALLGVTGLRAQVTIGTEPVALVAGMLARVAVSPGPGAPLEGLWGDIAGEPLHGESADGRVWKSLFGIPIGTRDSLPGTLVLVWDDGTVDTLRVAFPIGQATYPVERLRVAPRLAAPDNAGRSRIERDNARARRVSRLAHHTPRLWDEGFAAPSSNRITSAFGTAREFNGRVTGRHLGLDFDGAVGDPVRAANRGRVVLVANFYLAGRVIYLDHGLGLVTAYFHLNRTEVRPGDVVERGQKIATIGRSGRATGPHLHWVARYGGVNVDPQSLLSLLGDDSH